FLELSKYFSPQVVSPFLALATSSLLAGVEFVVLVVSFAPSLRVSSQAENTRANVMSREMVTIIFFIEVY
ncbi:MAG: hypothetical protein WAU72_01465, partial [Acidimicrobiia bacterium]